jgi:hypothetical protein
MEKSLTYKSIIDCLASMRDVQDIVAIDEHNYAPYHLCRARLKLKLKFECAFPNSHCFATRYKCVATINVDDEDRALDQYVARLLQLLLLLPPLVFALLLLYLQGLLSVATQVISVTACARIKTERLRSRAEYDYMLGCLIDAPLARSRVAVYPMQVAATREGCLLPSTSPNSSSRFGVLLDRLGHLTHGT